MKICKVCPNKILSCLPVFVWMVLAAFPTLPVPAPAAPPEESALVLSRIPSELKPYAIAPGQRIHRRGKERVSVSGTIFYHKNGLEKSGPVRIMWQHPMKMRFDQGGVPLIYNRNAAATRGGGDSKAADMIQMLLEDSVEGLFALQEKRISRRFLGSGFKLEGATESDPGMDVVLLEYADTFGEKRPILKSYWFDSCTKLLGVVAYTSSSGSLIHVVIDDWRDVSGEKIPFRIERWENGKPTIRLAFSSATVAAATNDGIFGGN